MAATTVSAAEMATSGPLLPDAERSEIAVAPRVRRDAVTRRWSAAVMSSSAEE